MAVVQHFQQTPKKKWGERTQMSSAHAWNQFTREAGSMAEKEHIPLDRAQVKSFKPMFFNLFPPQLICRCILNYSVCLSSEFYSTYGS